MIKDTLDKMILWISQNSPKFIGGLLGFLISVLILCIGLFKTLFIILFTIIGYTLGSFNISKEDIKKVIERVFSNR